MQHEISNEEQWFFNKIRKNSILSADVIKVQMFKFQNTVKIYIAEKSH